MGVTAAATRWRTPHLCYVELNGACGSYTHKYLKNEQILWESREMAYFTLLSPFTPGQGKSSPTLPFSSWESWTPHIRSSACPLIFTYGEGTNGIKHIYCMYLYYNLVCQSFEWWYYKIVTPFLFKQFFSRLFYGPPSVKVSTVVKFVPINSSCILLGLGKIKWAKLLMVLTTNYWPGN